uniref:Glutamate--tRNA ligase n=1 Tax=Candidatus Actinomarina minuta TaxID=1389454 RepID=S5DRZ7_9ACTN|nr:glutamyl- and glutaminyl-tRNA synthetases [Candidatus Actinomarina minuta]
MKLRIAPSPTGHLHIGNARTALFNWLYARANNGTFLVRIDDTDTARSGEEYINDIVKNFKWLGIDWDEGIQVGGPHGEYKQSLRFDRYREIAESLLSRGLAYEDEGAIRFKVPNENSIVFDDITRGSMKFELSDVEDFIILRSDKSPTYHLASTVDDIDYEITTIARGEDILSSTPKHILLMQALNADVPTFCHLPLLFGPDGKKLSKRHGDTSVSSFRDMGLLPEALFNYMCLLGWAPGNDLEIFDKDLVIQKFDLANVLPNPAIFDTTKLLWMNGQYIRNTSDDDFTLSALEKISQDLDRELFEKEISRIKKILPSVQERIETLNDLTPQIKFLLDEPFEVNQEEWNSVNSSEGQSYLMSIREIFKSLEDFSLSNIENIMREELKNKDTKPKIGFQITRVSVTGTKVSPPLFESIYALGKDAVLARLAESIEKL